MQPASRGGVAALLRLQATAGNRAVQRLVHPVIRRRFAVPRGGKAHHNAGGRGPAQQLIFLDSRVSGLAVPGYDIMDQHVSVFPKRDGMADDFHVTFELLPNDYRNGSREAERDAFEKAREQEAKQPSDNWRKKAGPAPPSKAGAVSVHFFYDEQRFIRHDLNAKFPKSMPEDDYDVASRMLRREADKVASQFADRYLD